MIRSALLGLLLAATTAATAAAQTPAGPRPFAITDNSLLVEEAFNQEAGVVQSVLFLQRPHGREWSLEFTQEWPLGGQRHQLSYTLPLEAIKPPGADDYDVARGTIALHYRYQLADEGSGPFAVSPRVSLLIPRGDIADQWGVQLNLPVSKQVGDVYAHMNAGLTVDAVGSSGRAARWHAAGSLIYRVLPMVHVLVESVYRADEHETLAGREDGWLISPGARVGFNLGDHQLVLAAAVPVGLLNDYDTQDFIAYISYELPFKRR
jgi:hypothetical protein